MVILSIGNISSHIFANFHPPGITPHRHGKTLKQLAQPQHGAIASAAAPPTNPLSIIPIFMSKHPA